MKQKMWLVFIMIFTLLCGCSEEREVKPFTYTKIFTGETEKTWLLEQVLVKKAGTADQPLDFSQCELDDRYTFKADEVRTFVVSNGLTVCEESEDPGDYVVDSWSFVNTGAVLSIAVPRVFGDFILPFIVREATKDRIVLEIFADQENTISYQLVMKSVSEQ
jgi:hypothetical protein